MQPVKITSKHLLYTAYFVRFSSASLVLPFQEKH